MKRQKERPTVVSRVYSYGTVPSRVAPVINEDLALKQMRIANQLWNVLVKIEKTRMERYRKIVRDENQERIDAMKAELDAARAELRQLRKSKNNAARKIELGNEIVRIGTAIRPLIEEAKSRRAEIHLQQKAQLDKLAEATKKRVKRARQAAGRMGLFWGSYNDILQRADAGRKHGGELRFRRFRGEGTLTAQLMGGARVERCVWGSKMDHSFFQIGPELPDKRFRRAFMRIGSDEQRGPVWLSIPIVYHRPLPPEANIRSVSMTRRLLAGQVKWQLNVTVNLPAPAPRTGDSRIAVDIGWRKVSTGIRVAYWVGSNGKEGELIVPERDVEAFEQVGRLRSTCDKLHNEFIPEFHSWIAGIENLPEEWKKRTANLLKWRSTDRIIDLITWWKDNRIPGVENEEEVYLGAMAYKREFLHLSTWWKNQQDQLSKRVRERYRIFAAYSALAYDRLVIEDFDLREVAKIPKAEDRTGTDRVGQRARQFVAPSEFRSALLNAFRREGCQVEEIPAANTTRTCHKCGSLEEFDQAADLQHRCSRCGATWDQDENAARNLLRIAQETAGSVETRQLAG